MSELGKIKILNYHAEHGRSGYTVKCECGRVQFVYCWSGVKKCECGRLLHIRYSPEGRDIVVTPADLGIRFEPSVRVAAPCSTCGKEIHYVHGMGWSHEGDKDLDHPALPVPDKIKRLEERI